MQPGAACSFAKEHSSRANLPTGRSLSFVEIWVRVRLAGFDVFELSHDLAAGWNMLSIPVRAHDAVHDRASGAGYIRTVDSFEDMSENLKCNVCKGALRYRR